MGMHVLQGGMFFVLWKTILSTNVDKKFIHKLWKTNLIGLWKSVKHFVKQLWKTR